MSLALSCSSFASLASIPSLAMDVGLTLGWAPFGHAPRPLARLWVGVGRPSAARLGRLALVKVVGGVRLLVTSLALALRVPAGGSYLRT